MRGWVVCVCLLAAAPASAEAPATQPADVTDATHPPSVQFPWCPAISLAASANHKPDDRRSADGLSLGNVVGHVSASLGGKFSFYSDNTVNQKHNKLTIDVARAITRYDYNGRFKVS